MIIHDTFVVDAVPAASSLNLIPFSTTDATTVFSEPPFAEIVAKTMSSSETSVLASVSSAVEPVQTYVPHCAIANALAPKFCGSTSTMPPATDDVSATPTL